MSELRRDGPSPSVGCWAPCLPSVFARLGGLSGRPPRLRVRSRQSSPWRLRWARANPARLVFRRLAIPWPCLHATPSSAVTPPSATPAPVTGTVASGRGCQEGIVICGHFGPNLDARLHRAGDAIAVRPCQSARRLDWEPKAWSMMARTNKTKQGGSAPQSHGHQRLASPCGRVSIHRTMGMADCARCGPSPSDVRRICGPRAAHFVSAATRPVTSPGWGPCSHC